MLQLSVTAPLSYISLTGCGSPQLVASLGLPRAKGCFLKGCGSQFRAAESQGLLPDEVGCHVT